MSSTAQSSNTFETLEIEYIGAHIAHIKLNRPRQGNAMNVKMVYEIPAAMKFLSQRSDLRCVMMTGNGKHFSTGVDLQDPVFALKIDQDEVARRSIIIYKFIKELQATVTSIEELNVPVLIGIHNACIGLACEFALAGDYRICTNSSFFEFKEVDVGIAADMGLLQRLPVACTNDSLIRELVFTGNRFNAATALQLGMVSKVAQDEASMRKELLEVAMKIAEKSPVAIWTIKSILNHQRHRTILPNLDYMARLNAPMVQTNDISEALGAVISKEKGVFPKL